MAGVGAVESILESELSCPVCLTIYRDPVSLGCGHCFCKQCITDALCHQRDQGRSYTCPMCQAPYEGFPTFLKNFQLCNIVENYLTMQKNSEDCQILCGDCLDHPSIAVKTCVGCEVSLCQKHAERHIQRKHTLLEPTASVQERKCAEHDKLLEYNCEQDNNCICVTCYIAGPHKGHNIMTLKEAHANHLATLSETTASLSASISAFSMDIADLKVGLVKIAENKVKLCKPLEDLRDRIILLVERQFNEIIEAITDHQDKATTEMTAIIKQIEDAKANTENALEELNLLSKQPDDLLFIKTFSRLQGVISQQSLHIDTMQVVDVEADKVMMKNIETETTDHMVEIGQQLNILHNVLSQQIVKLVWSGTQRNKVQNQNHAPPIRSKKSEKLNLMFLKNSYTHCSYSVIVSNQNKTLTTNVAKSFPQPYFMSSIYPPGVLSTPSNTNCQCKLPVLIPVDAAISTSSSKAHFLVNVRMSYDWCVGVTNTNSGVFRFLQWTPTSLSYQADTSLLLGSAKLNILKVQLDFDAQVLGFYDVSNESETPILTCKCDDIFHGPINVGFNVFHGSLSLI